MEYKFWTINDIKELKSIYLLISWWKLFCKNHNTILLHSSLLIKKIEHIKIFA